MFGLSEKIHRNLFRLVLALVGGSIPVVLLLLLTASDVQAAPSPRPLADIVTATTSVVHTSDTTHRMRVFADGRISNRFYTYEGFLYRNQIDLDGDTLTATTIAVMFDQHAETSNPVDVGAQGEFVPTTPITRYTSPDNNYPRYSEDTAVIYASQVLSYQIAQRTLATTTNDCVIMELDVQNTGGAALTGGKLLYMVDIDSGTQALYDEGFYDPVRRLVGQSDYNGSWYIPLHGFAMGISLLKGDWRGYGINGNSYPVSDTQFQAEMNTPANTITNGDNDVSWIVADIPDLASGQMEQLAFGICAKNDTTEPGAREELREEHDEAVDLGLMVDKTIDGNWTRRVKLTFTNAAQTEDLIDFPVLVALDASRVYYTQTQDAGQDIRFVDLDGTLLAHEIEAWDETGTSYVWVNVPQIDGGSNADYVWMYYGNPDAPDGQDPEGVWASNYRMVYHLADGPGPPGMPIRDSTVNSFDGTNRGSTAYSSGFIAGARDFNGTGAYIDLGSDLAALNGVGQATLSAWIRPDLLGTATRRDIIAISVGGNPTVDSRATIYQLGRNIGVVARAPDSQAMDMINTTSSPLSLRWYYVVAVIDYAGNAVTIYVDGDLQPLSHSPNFEDPTTSDVNSAVAALGSEDDGTIRHFNGRIDEARVAAAPRSTDWITAQYASMTDSFITYGSQESTLASVGSGVVGAPFTYTIAVTNTGLAQISNVVVTDVVSSGASYVSGGSYNPSIDTVSWVIPSITAAEAESVTFVVSTCQSSIINESYRAVTSMQGISSSHGTPLLTVLRPPALEAQFVHSPPMATVGSTVFFTSTSTTDGSPIVAWGWDFGDGDTASGPTTSHAYASPGDFVVTLTVTDTCGFVDAVSKTITVYPEVSFSGVSYTVGEGDGTATITMTLNAVPVVTATVDYATSDGTAAAGSDYVAASGTLTFTPGTTVQTFDVTINDDALDEANETVNLTLSGAVNATVGGTNPATLTIVDDDPQPTVAFESGSYSVGEGDGAATITVTLSAASGQDVMVNYATSDGTAEEPGDYGSVSGILTFVAGTTVQTFTVGIVDDGLDEGDETVNLTLSGAVNGTIGGTNPATLTIMDDDTAGVNINPTTVSVTEGGAGATYTVVLDSEPTGVVTIAFDTGTQVTGIGAITFDGTNWAMPQTVNVSAVDDALVEGAHVGTIMHSVTSSDGNYDGIGIASVTVNITDNDVVGGLAIAKTAVDLNGAPLRLGDEIEYHVLVTNGDTSAHTNVIISDWMPQNTSLVAGSESCSPGATCAAYFDPPPDDVLAFGADYQPADSGGVVIASMGSLASGQVFTLTFRVRVHPNILSIDGNVAVVESDTQGPLATSPTCPPGGCTVVAGLTATKEAVDLNGAPLVAGEVVEYRILVTNGGDGETNVTITDTVPTNMTLVAGSVTCSAGVSCGEVGGEIAASVGSLGSGEAITLAFQARVDACITSVGGNVAFFWSDDQGRQKTLPAYPPGRGVVLACSPDLYEDDDTPAQAAYLPVGLAHQAHTFCDDAADWSAFTVLAGEVYTVTTSSWGLNADTFLTVVGTDGVTVLAVNDDCPGATDGSSCIVWTAPSSGVYYVRTSNRDGLSGCNTEYEVWVETRTEPVRVYLPLVMRDFTQADLPPDIRSGSRGKLGLVADASRGRASELDWVGRGSLVFALLGVQKVLNVRKKK
jgi:uncharacterized repeat protein (TIGR01451 family)